MRILITLTLVFLPALAQAKVSAEEAARLGADLTPVGADKAGNADNSIPEWTPAKQRGELSGTYPTNPEYDAEKPLYTITQANMAEYEDVLTEGHKKLLMQYDTYKMNVYPSHRPVSFPDFIYKWTQWNASNCELLDPDTPDNCKIGFTFPIPKNGAEVMWNHKVRYRGSDVRRYNNQMIVQQDGSYQLTKIVEEAKFYYALPPEKDPVPLKKGSGLFIKYFSETISPPRMAGQLILAHERAGTGADGRQAWVYNPGLRRIRRAPGVCCDNPYEGTDGHQFYDQVDMFNGVLERFDWKLLGKKEVIIPYNSNQIGSPDVSYDDLASPFHINPELPRYEKHRVWVVEANIRQGTNHTFHKRRFYVDEDSWYPSAVDNYDARGEMMQFQEGHTIFAYNIQSVGGVPEVIYHFNSGRYFVTAMANEERPNDFSVELDDRDFEASAVSKRARR